MSRKALVWYRCLLIVSLLLSACGSQATTPQAATPTLPKASVNPSSLPTTPTVTTAVAQAAPTEQPVNLPEYTGYTVELLARDTFLPRPATQADVNLIIESNSIFLGGGGGGGGLRTDMCADDGYEIQGLTADAVRGPLEYLFICNVKPVRLVLYKPFGSTYQRELAGMETAPEHTDNFEFNNLICIPYRETAVEGDYRVVLESLDGQEQMSIPFQVNLPVNPFIALGNGCSNVAFGLWEDEISFDIFENQPVDLFFSGFLPEEELEVTLFFVKTNPEKSIERRDPTSPLQAHRISYHAKDYKRVSSWRARVDEKGRLVQYLPSVALAVDGRYVLAAAKPGEMDPAKMAHQLWFDGYRAASEPVSIELSMAVKSESLDSMLITNQTLASRPPAWASCPDDHPGLALEGNRLTICGLQNGQIAELVVAQPEGSTYRMDLLVGGGSPLHYCLDPRALLNPGNYRLTLLSETEGVLAEVEVTRVDESRAQIMMVNGGLASQMDVGPVCAWHGRLLFRGFRPGEKVQLGVYQFREEELALFRVALAVQTDDHGELFGQLTNFDFQGWENSPAAGLLVASGPGSELSDVGWFSLEPYRPDPEIDQPLAFPELIRMVEMGLDPAAFKMLAHIPAGAFQMGADPTRDRLAETSEQPAHTVNVSDFWIMPTEVTVSQYGQCVGAKVCTPPSNTGSESRAEYFQLHGASAFDTYPVVNVTWAQAQAYCNWLGGRLPTEAEWEKAARGIEGRLYPWGNQPATLELANFKGGPGDTEDVLNYEAGATPEGVLNLAGNVWEWVGDWYGEDYYSESAVEDPTGPDQGSQRVVRGGSYGTNATFLRATNRFYRDPEQGYPSVGFRCVATAQPETNGVTAP